MFASSTFLRRSWTTVALLVLLAIPPLIHAAPGAIGPIRLSLSAGAPDRLNAALRPEGSIFHATASVYPSFVVTGAEAAVVAAWTGATAEYVLDATVRAFEYHGAPHHAVGSPLHVRRRLFDSGGSFTVVTEEDTGSWTNRATEVYPTLAEAAEAVGRFSGVALFDGADLAATGESQPYKLYVTISLDETGSNLGTVLDDLPLTADSGDYPEVRTTTDATAPAKPAAAEDVSVTAAGTGLVDVYVNFSDDTLVTSVELWDVTTTAFLVTDFSDQKTGEAWLLPFLNPTDVGWTKEDVPSAGGDRDFEIRVTDGAAHTTTYSAGTVTVPAPPAGADLYEEDDAYRTSSSITLGTAQARSLHDLSDVDVVRLDLAARTDLVATAWPATGTISLDVQDDTGTSLASASGTLASTATVSLPALLPGTYYLRTSTASAGGIPGYVLGAASSTGDSYEDNDRFDEAQDLPLETPVNATIHMVGDVDWYRFELPNSCDCAVMLDGGSDQLDAELYDGLGRSMNSFSGVAFSLATSGTGSGTYYLRVLENGSDATATYGMTIVTAPVSADSPQDAHEPNDTVDAPYTWDLSTRVWSNSFHTAGDEDWYTFTAGGTYTILWETLAGAGDPVLELYASDKTSLLASSDDDGTGRNALLRHDVTSGATYYVRLYEKAGEQVANYTLRVTRGASVPGVDATEGDDGFSQAIDLVADTRVDRSIHINEERDFFRFSLSRRSKIKLATFDADTTLYLYDENLEQIASDMDSGPQGLGDSLLQGTYVAGVYYVQVGRHNDGGALASYGLRLDLGTPDAYEYDNGAGFGGSIAADETQDRSIHVIGDQDYVWFTVDATATVTLTTSGTAGDTTLFIYNSVGGFVGSATGGGFGAFAVYQNTNMAAGDYYAIILENGNDATIDAYTLTYEVGPPSGASVGADLHEADDARGQASVLVAGATQYHSMHVFSDVDWIRFEVLETSDVALATTGAWADTELTLYDLHGTALGSSTTTGLGQSSVSLENLAPGSYWARVRWTGSLFTAFAYGLDLTLSPSGAVAADGYEPDDDRAAATAIADGESQSHSIDDGATGDFVRFTIPMASAVTLVTTGTAGDPMVELYDEWGTLLGSIADEGAALFPRLTTSPLPAGTYFGAVRAERGAGSVVPAYDLSLDVVILPDAYESDDDVASANPIVDGEIQDHNLHTASDADWTSFTLSVTSHVRLETTGTLGGDTILTLYQSDGTTMVDTDDDSGTDAYSLVEVDGVAPGTYTVEVTGKGGALLDHYGLNLELQPTAPSGLAGTPGDESVALTWTAVSGATSYRVWYDDDISDPWDPTVTATEGASGFSVASNSATVSGIPNGVIHRFAVSAVAATGESALSGAIVETPEKPVDETFETGDFSAWNWVTGGSADWTVETTDTVHGGTHSARSAAGLGANQSSWLEITLSVQEGDLRFWRKVSSAAPDGLDLLVDGTSVLSVAGDQDWSEETAAVTSGAHTFRFVYSKDGAGDGGDDLCWLDDITFPRVWTTAVDDGNEPNDGAAQATGIVAGQTYTASIHANGDYDYYSFTLTETSDVRAWTSGESGELQLFLYDDPITTSLGTNEAGAMGPNSVVTADALPAGNYLVSVQEDGMNATVPAYALYLDVTRTPPAADAWEANDTAGTARAVTDGQSTAGLTIHQPGDVDWSTFTLTEAADLTLTLSGTEGDTVLTLYQSDGTTVVDSDDDGGTGTFSALSVPALPAGTYLVKVEEKGNDGMIWSYSYDLNLVPVAPTGLAAVAGNGSLSLSWNAVTGATSYRVYYDDDASNPPWDPTTTAAQGAPPVTVTAPTASLDLTGLANGYPLQIAVTTVSGLGESAPSPEISATPNIPIDEDFESGDLTAWKWVTGGDDPWAVQGTTVYNGSFSAASGSSTPDGGLSWLDVTMAVQAGDLRFRRKVSSESPGDWFELSVDGTAVTSLAGDEDWALHVEPIAAGAHTFRFAYRKDGASTALDDRCYVDDISFPAAAATAPVADGYEPDNSSGAAKTIAHGEVQTRTIHDAFTDDWASFTVNEESAVTVEATGQNGAVDLWVSDASMIEVPSPSAGQMGPASRVSWVTAAALYPRTYLVKVNERGYDATVGAYALRLSIVPTGGVAADAYEVDDSFAAARTIVSGVAQPHTIHDLGDHDHVTFTLTGPHDVVLGTSGSSGDTVLTLYDGSYGFVGQDDDGGSGTFSQLTTASLPSGVYYVMVNEKNDDELIASYSLSFTATPANPAPDAYEDDDTFATASSIAPGDSQNRSIDVAGDSDVVGFTLTEPSDVVATTAGTAGDTVLYLFDASQILLGQDDDGGSGGFSRLTTSLPTGSYYLWIDEKDADGTIESYTLSLSASLSIDAYEDDDSFATASSISNGETQDRNVAPAGDGDYVSFTLGATSDVTLQTAGMAGDTVLYLYDASQTLVGQDDDGGSGGFSVLTTPSLPAGTYTVLVEEKGNDAIIDAYTLSLTVSGSGPGADAYEEDDDFVDASDLISGSPQTHSIDPENDPDYARFVLSEASDVVIETSGVAGDTELFLYDGTQSQIALDDDSGTGTFSLISRANLPAGTYYVMVRDKGQNDFIASYQLSLTVTPTGPPPPPADSYEPDDDFGSATALTASVTQNRSIHELGNRDYATFTLDGLYDVAIETTGSAGDTVLHLYDGSRTLLDSDDDGGSGTFSLITRSRMPAGTYFVMVEENGGDEYIDAYGLLLTRAPATLTPDAYEPDDDYMTPSPIMPTGVAQDHNIHVVGDVDWVTFDVGSVDVTVTASAVGEAAMLKLSLYTGGGQLLAQESNAPTGEDLSLTITDILPGTYACSIEEEGNDDLVSAYRIAVSTAPATAGGDAFEVDDDFGDAKTITPGELQAHSFHTGTDVDTVRFTLASPTDVTILTTGPFDVDTVIDVYDGSFTLVASDDDSGAPPFSAVVLEGLAAGTYYAKIREKSGATAIIYNVSLAVLPAAPAAVRAFGDATGFRLEWDSVPGASLYRVYYDDDGTDPWDPVPTAPQGAPPIEISGTSLTLTGLTPGQDYRIGVSTVIEDVESADKALVSSSVGPPKIANVSATDGTLADRVTVTWNVEPTADYYRVYRAGAAAGPYTAIAGMVAASSYDDTSALSGEFYYYKVVGYRNGSEGTLSDADSGYVSGSGSGAPILEVSPLSVTFTAMVGAPDPASQTFALRNFATGTLNWTVSETSTWLSVLPASGDSTGEWDDVTLSTGMGTLAQGSYTSNVTVASVDASNSPVTVAVRLNVVPTTDGFEAGAFSTWPWQTSGDGSWTVVSGGYAGIHSAASPALLTGQTATLELRLSTIGGYLEYRRRVTGTNADVALQVFVNGVPQETVSGGTTWGLASFPVTAGTNRVLFVVSKSSDAAGLAYLDEVTFTTTQTPPPDPGPGPGPDPTPAPEPPSARTEISGGCAMAGGGTMPLLPPMALLVSWVVMRRRRVRRR